MIDVVIVGGGLAGLAAGRYLSSRSIRCVIIEGRNRVGGGQFRSIGPNRVQSSVPSRFPKGVRTGAKGRSRRGDVSSWPVRARRAPGI